MASPSRLEEGWASLPGQVLEGSAGVAGAAGQVPGRVLGSCNGGLGTAVGPWEVARRQRIPDTPFSTPSRTTSEAQQQRQQQGTGFQDPWARYVGAGGRTEMTAMNQQGYQQVQGNTGPLNTGHVLFQHQTAEQVQQGQQQVSKVARFPL